MNGQDHDILIRLDQKVQDGFMAVNTEIKLLRDGTHQKILDLETNKLEKTVFSTYKTDTDKMIAALFKSDGELKRNVYIGMGIVLAIEFIALLVKG